MTNTKFHKTPLKKKKSDLEANGRDTLKTHHMILEKIDMRRQKTYHIQNFFLSFSYNRTMASYFLGVRCMACTATLLLQSDRKKRYLYYNFIPILIQKYSSCKKFFKKKNVLRIIFYLYHVYMRQFYYLLYYKIFSSSLLKIPSTTFVSNQKRSCNIVAKNIGLGMSERTRL